MEDVREVCPSFTRLVSFKDCLFVYTEDGWQRVELDDWVVCDRQRIRIVNPREFVASYVPE